MKILGVLFFSASSLAASVASPTTWYVATTGSDSTGNGSAGKPFQTIVKGVSAASSGDTVLVEPGTYQEEVDIRKPGIMLKSQVQWGARMIMPSVSSLEEAIGVHGAKDVTIDGFYIDGDQHGVLKPLQQWYTGIYASALNPTIKNNKVVNIDTIPPGIHGSNGAAGIGVAADWSVHPHNIYVYGLVANNWIGSVGFWYIDPKTSNPTYLRHGIYPAAVGTTIVNNIVWQIPGGQGITSWHAANKLIIANNLVFNVLSGIVFDNDGEDGSGPADYGMIFNNIVVNADTTHEDYQNAIGGVGAHSLYSNNAIYNWPYAYRVGPGTVTNPVNADPKFNHYKPDGTGDYTLQSLSPCIDAGTDNLGGFAAPAYAITGTARPVGPAYDIGPYEAANANGALTITSALTASGLLETAFSYQITATHSPTRFNATGLPPGLSVNTATGLISGTPTSAGYFYVTISASNASDMGSATLALTISRLSVK